MRLIDADALSKDLEKRWNVNDDQDFCNKEVWHALEEAPTIEPDGDTIRRHDVIKLIKTSYYDLSDGEEDIWAMVHDVEQLPSAEVEDRLYTKIYADDEPSVKAEKLYQICGETQNREVAEWLKEYFPSAPDSRQRGTNKEIAERIIDNTCKKRVFCELYPDACQKEKCDIYLVINTFLNTPDIDTQIRQRGEWVRNDKIGTFKIFTCDKCGCNMDTDVWDFCPNCGAYMGGQYDGQKR